MALEEGPRAVGKYIELDSANDQGDIIQYELTLQRLAMVRIARALWEKNWIKQEWIQMFTERRKNQYGLFSIRPMKERNSLIKRVLFWCESLCESTGLCRFPHIVENLMYIIEFMGVQIHEWLKGVNPKLRKFTDEHQESAIKAYIHDIIWTDIGTIDYTKTMRNMINRKKFPNNYMEYCAACINCFKDEIEKWHKIKSEMDSIYGFVVPHCRNLENGAFAEIRVECEYDFHLIFYWNLFRKKGHTNWHIHDFIFRFVNSSDVENIYSSDRSVDANMFLLCAFNDNYPGVEYFWYRMDKESQIDNINEAIIKILKPRSADLYGAKLQIAIFLFHRMLPENWQQFLNSMRQGSIHMNSVITILTWPWSDFSFPPVQTLKNYFPDGFIHRFGCIVMTNIFDILSSGDSDLSGRKKSARKLAFKILKICPDKIRERVDIETYSTPATIRGLLKTNDFFLIKTFINHPVMKDLRSFFFCEAALYYSLAVNIDHCNMSEEFKKHVLLDEDEREAFSRLVMNV